MKYIFVSNEIIITRLISHIYDSNISNVLLKLLTIPPPNDNSINVIIDNVSQMNLYKSIILTRIIDKLEQKQLESQVFFSLLYIRNLIT